MRKHLLAFLALGIAVGASAQTIVAKKGKINAGDSVIAKYDSKGSIFRAYDINIKSLSDEPLLNLKEEGHDFESPYADPVGWYRISFPNTDLPQMRYRMTEQLNEKRIFAQVLFPENAPLLLADGKLNRAVVDSLAGSTHAYDYAADSARVRQLETANAARIKKVIPRDITKPFDLQVATPVYQRPHPEPGERTVAYDIYQGGFLLGQVMRRSHYESSELHYDFSVWMKTEPYTYEGQSMTFSPLAFFVNASATFDNKVVLMKDKSKIKLKTPNPTAAEYLLVRLLIDSGNL